MSKEFEKILKSNPFFDENNCQELKVRMIGDFQCCVSRDDNGKLVFNKAPLHPFYDGNDNIIGYLGWCNHCKKSWYYEGKD